MHWSKCSTDVECHDYYKSNPLKLLPIRVMTSARGDTSVFCLVNLWIFLILLKYVIIVAGFWYILLNVSCKLESCLWIRGFMPMWHWLSWRVSQHLLLCGSAFNLINLNLYWAAKLMFSRKHSSIFILWFQSIAGGVGIAVVFCDGQDLVCSFKPDSLLCFLYEHSTNKTRGC